jgi:hypothetical protein
MVTGISLGRIGVDVFELLDGRAQPAGERIAAGKQPDDDETVGAVVVLDDFVAKPAYRPLNLVRPKVRRGSHEKRLPRSSGQARKMSW